MNIFALATRRVTLFVLVVSIIALSTSLTAHAQYGTDNRSSDSNDPRGSGQWGGGSSPSPAPASSPTPSRSSAPSPDTSDPRGSGQWGGGSSYDSSQAAPDPDASDPRGNNQWGGNNDTSSDDSPTAIPTPSPDASDPRGAGQWGNSGDTSSDASSQGNAVKPKGLIQRVTGGLLDGYRAVAEGIIAARNTIFGTPDEPPVFATLDTRTNRPHEKFVPKAAAPDFIPLPTQPSLPENNPSKEISKETPSKQASTRTVSVEQPKITGFVEALDANGKVVERIPLETTGSPVLVVGKEVVAIRTVINNTGQPLLVEVGNTGRNLALAGKQSVDEIVSFSANEMTVGATTKDSNNNQAAQFVTIVQKGTTPSLSSTRKEAQSTRVVITSKEVPVAEATVITGSGSTVASKAPATTPNPDANDPRGAGQWGDSGNSSSGGSSQGSDDETSTIPEAYAKDATNIFSAELNAQINNIPVEEALRKMWEDVRAENKIVWESLPVPTELGSESSVDEAINQIPRGAEADVITDTTNPVVFEPEIASLGDSNAGGEDAIITPLMQSQMAYWQELENSSHLLLLVKLLRKF